MEATNISIKQQSSVSIKQSSSVSINIGTLQEIKQRVLSAAVNFSLFTVHFSLSRLYRKELRIARAVARAIDAHPTISNIALWLMGIGIMVEVFLFA